MKLGHRGAFGVAALACACGARTGLGVPMREDASVHDASADVHPKDAAPDADDAGPDAPPSPLCAVVDAGPPAQICTVSVRVGVITKSSGTCFVDTIVHTNDVGTIRYACGDAGSDWAVADFDGGSFPGSISGDVVNLCTGTTFPWSDGCTWASAQRIAGGIEAGTLELTYDEQPIEGGTCDPPCGASAPVLVQ